MSIEAKHAYRFGYLKSDQWQNVRLEALVREAALCEICGEESISNDVHHLWYPDNIYKTQVCQLVVLCRPCHDFTHAMMPHFKCDESEKAVNNWFHFKTSVSAWRRARSNMFRQNSGLPKLETQPMKKMVMTIQSKTSNIFHTAKIKTGLSDQIRELLTKLYGMVCEWDDPQSISKKPDSDLSA